MFTGFPRAWEDKSTDSQLDDRRNPTLTKARPKKRKSLFVLVSAAPETLIVLVAADK